jgi:uroporphyrinogen-III synthase
MSLSGKTILLTRQPEQSGDLLRDIEDRGGCALLFPTIRIVPPESWSACDLALDRLASYDGFVFTSPNAVGRFLTRASERGVDLAALRTRPLWAVGEKTAGELRAHALEVEPLPEEYTGASLAARIRAKTVIPGRLLVPRGDLASEALPGELRGNGFAVDAVVVYRTVPPSGQDAGELRAKLRSGVIDVVTFFSPSAARNFAAVFRGDALASILSRSVVAVIGPVTRDAVRALGVEPAVVAERSTARGLVDAIEQHFTGSS